MAEMKDLNRHMWAHHRDEARRRGLPGEVDQCLRCGYWGRKDNLKRHKDTKGALVKGVEIYNRRSPPTNDLKTLASASDDSTIKLWNTAAGT